MDYAKVDYAKVIEHLNRALSIEYSAVIQYCQHSALVEGTDRKVYEDFFEGASKEARTHAKKVSDWIVSLGGVPTIEAAHIQQATDVTEMLKQDLKTEQEALQAYRDAHAAVPGEMPIKYLLEEQIMLEQQDVWELEKYLAMHKIKVKTKTIDLAAS
jgi:bacterioferritin